MDTCKKHNVFLICLSNILPYHVFHSVQGIILCSLLNIQQCYLVFFFFFLAAREPRLRHAPQVSRKYPEEQAVSGAASCLPR